MTLPRQSSKRRAVQLALATPKSRIGSRQRPTSGPRWRLGRLEAEPRIAAEHLDVPAAAGELRDHARHGRILPVPFHVDEKDVLPWRRALRSRLDTREIDPFFVEDLERALERTAG